MFFWRTSTHDVKLPHVVSQKVFEWEVLGCGSFCLSQSRKLSFHEAGEGVLLQTEGLSVKCVVQRPETRCVTCLRTASVQGIQVSLALTELDCTTSGSRMLLCSLLNPGKQNTVVLLVLDCPAPLHKLHRFW